MPDTHSAPPPRHVAVIMDGNGRWATRRHLPRVKGHAAGVGAVRRAVEHSVRRGVSFLTLYAFSSENWQRPADEVSTLMRLFVAALEREVDQLVDNGVRLRVVGELGAFEPRLQQLIAQAHERTAGNDRLQLTVCAGYGGRWDVAQAVRRMLAEDPRLCEHPQRIDEALIARHLALGFAPDPDLLIRTGGDQRISNFLLWQAAYAELYFTEVLWPDFDATAYDQALRWYASRERRFGRIQQATVAA